MAGGCGGDDDESAAKDGQQASQDSAPPTSYSAAGEPPRVFVERTAKLLETASGKKDCLELADLNRHSLSQFPCPSPKPLSKSMARFDVVGIQEYGTTAAVVDYKSGQVNDGAAILLFVAPDRKWGISRFGVVTPPSTETRDVGKRDGYDKALDDYLAAVREGDCKAFAKVAFVSEQSEKKGVCKTAFAATGRLAKLLKDNPSAKPVYEGGNASYGFYTLETERPEPANATISLVASGSGSKKPYMVLDVAPSPTAASQARIRRAFELQQKRKKDGNQPETSPSRKADPPPDTQTS